MLQCLYLFVSQLSLRLLWLHLWYRGMGFPGLPGIPGIRRIRRIRRILRPELEASHEAQEIQGTHGAQGRHLSRNVTKVCGEYGQISNVGNKQIR